MSVKFEEQEHNLVKLTVEVPVEEVKKAEDKVYLKMRGRVQLPGFRKGKAPKEMIERAYGKGVFLEDAVNEIIPQAYEDACDEVEKEQNITLASYPEIEYTQVEVDKPVIFTATVAKKPAVKLGKYKGLKVEKQSTEVTEEDINKALDEERTKNSTVVPVEGRSVEDGDIVSLDFLGKVDGVAFPGGEGKDYPLTIGSHSFIEGFEEQLVGMNKGETKDINVTFPEVYQEPTLAGKPAVFTCTINEIKARELPELNDEFASEVSEFETLAEYKEDVKKKLAEKKEAEAKTAKENEVLDKAVEEAEIDVPELMIKSEAQANVRSFAERLKSQGLSIEQYAQYLGKTQEDMVNDQMEPAKKAILGRLVLEAVAEAENIEVTDEDVDKEFARMAEQYGIEVEKMKEFATPDQVEAMKKDLATGKALDLMVAEAK